MKNNKHVSRDFFYFTDTLLLRERRESRNCDGTNLRTNYSCKNRVLPLFTRGSCALSWLSTVVTLIHIWIVSTPRFPPSPRSSTPPPLPVLLFIKRVQRISFYYLQGDALARPLLHLFISHTPLTSSQAILANLYAVVCLHQINNIFFLNSNQATAVVWL